MNEEDQITAIVNKAALAVAKTDEKLALSLLDAMRILTRERNEAIGKCQRYYEAVRRAWQVAMEGAIEGAKNETQSDIHH